MLILVNNEFETYVKLMSLYAYTTTDDWFKDYESLTRLDACALENEMKEMLYVLLKKKEMLFEKVTVRLR